MNSKYAAIYEKGPRWIISSFIKRIGNSSFSNPLQNYPWDQDVTAEYHHQQQQQQLLCQLFLVARPLQCSFLCHQKNSLKAQKRSFISVKEITSSSLSFTFPFTSHCVNFIDCILNIENGNNSHLNACK